MNDTSSLVWSMFFGAIGTGFLIYGRRQRMLIPFLSGIGLMVVPYFVDNVVAMIVLCVAFMALPYFVRR